MGKDEVKILSSTWYHYPNCAITFDPQLVEGAGTYALIGIVTFLNDKGEVQRYIGTGVGKNQNDDEIRIIAYGVPFYG